MSYLEDFWHRLTCNCKRQWGRTGRHGKLFLIMAWSFALLVAIWATYNAISDLTSLSQGKKVAASTKENVIRTLLQYLVLTFGYCLFSFTAIFWENHYDLIAFVLLFGYGVSRMLVDAVAHPRASFAENVSAAIIGALAVAFLVFLCYKTFRAMGHNSQRVFYAVGSNVRLRHIYLHWLRFQALIRIDYVYCILLFITGLFVVWEHSLYKRVLGACILVIMLLWYFAAVKFIKNEIVKLVPLWMFFGLLLPFYGLYVLARHQVTAGKATATLLIIVFCLVRGVVMWQFQVCVRHFEQGFPETAFAPGKPDGPPAKEQTAHVCEPTDTTVTTEYVRFEASTLAMK